MDQWLQMEKRKRETRFYFQAPVKMKSPDGTEVSFFSKTGGHFVTVTGTQGDYFTVSSWGDGQSYAVDPSDYENEGYFFVAQVKF